MSKKVSAKDIVVKQIDSRTGNAFVRKVHYSGKVAANSQIHLGVFLDGFLHGVMQYGPSLDKRKMLGLVKGTKWHNFLELNRMAFDDKLPRNSESRALAVSFRLLRKYAPQVKWVISFADATQCGDGTIYRAAGFILTDIKVNDQIWIAPDPEDAKGKGEKAQKLISRFSATKGRNVIHAISTRVGKHKLEVQAGGGASMKQFEDAGFKPLDGFQLRYIYFLDPSWRQRLAVPEIPFSRIAEVGASMYKGAKTNAGD